MHKINFVFFGTPDVAKETLDILKESGYMPSLIITAPDKPKGRKMIITPPPVKVWALNQSKLGSGQTPQNKIPVLQPENFRGQDVVFKNIAQAGEPSIVNFQQEIMRVFKNNILPDLFIVVAYGKILPKEILEIPKLGSINIHYSLLPKYRGASPVESAILNSETETGVTIQQMEFKMDSGPILAFEKTEILPDEKAPDLRKRLIKIGGDLLVKTLPDIIDGKIKPSPQNEQEATFCKKIQKEDGLLDLNDDPVKNYNKFRAYATWPRTYFIKDEKRNIITEAKLENSKFVIKKIIPEGKKEINYKE